MRRTFASVFALALIVFVLAPAPGVAAPRQAPHRVVGAPVTGAWSFWMAVRWGFPGLAGVWEKIGISADPDGLNLKAPEGALAQKIGTRADPDGEPLVSPQFPLPAAEIVPSADPNGK